MTDPEIIVEETEAVIEVAADEVTEVVLEVNEESVIIEDAHRGPQGIPGPSGFVHQQTVPSAEWVIDHDLDKHPAVDVVDSASNVVIGEIHYNSDSRVTITFRAPFAGRAFLN